jgi:hypothetical protein
MSELRLIDFLIVGTPKSGTRYIAEIFKKLGIETWHERFIGPRSIQLHNMKRDVYGSVDYATAGIIHQLPKSILIVQHLRHPVDACNSLMKTATFTTWRPWADIWGMPDGYDETINFKNISQEQREAEASHFWFQLNSRVAKHANFRWRVENTDEIHAGIMGLLTRIQKRKKIMLPQAVPERVREAIEAVEVGYGHNQGKFADLTTMTWDRLPGSCKKFAMDMGYAGNAKHARNLEAERMAEVS